MPIQRFVSRRFVRKSRNHCRTEQRNEVLEERTLMKYFAALLPIRDLEKCQELRPAHVEFLEQKSQEGKIFARGRFSDGAGGLVIYMAETLEEAKKTAASDPYVMHGARSLELHEWDMKLVG
jgi:uncharacterized protein YciI